MRIYTLVIIMLTAVLLHAQERSPRSMEDYLRMNSADAFRSDEAWAVADSVMKYQMACGGWPKNQQWARGAEQAVMAQCKATGIGATIDNGATWQEIRFLARMYDANAQTADARVRRHLVECRNAVVKGIGYLLVAQYDNGGWPQFYPVRPQKEGVHYSAHITYNDGAMTSVIRLMYDVAKGRQPFASLELSDLMRSQAQHAYDKGIECILKCQIVSGGVPTVWCAQHDEVTLLPAKARAYELPSYSGHGETVDVLGLLMDITDPSPEVKASIEAAVRWLEAHAIHDTAVEHYTNADGKRDIRLVHSQGAPRMWARFYDLETARPMYCDRDGVPQTRLEDIGHERRNGYSWVGTSPARLIDKWRGK